MPYFKSKVNLSSGLGLIVEINRKNYVDFFAFQGKLNKQQTDIASSIIEINGNNLNEFLLEFEDQVEQKIILNSILINQLLTNYKNHKAVQFLTKAVLLFQEILPTIEGKYLFSYDTKNSLVRKNLEPLSIANKPVKLYFTLSESDFFYTLKAKLKIGDENFNLNATKLIISPLFILYNNVIYPINSADLSISIEYYSRFQEQNYFKKDFEKIYQKIILPLSKKHEIESKVFKKEKKSKNSCTDEAQLSKQVYISDLEGEFVIFKLCVQYPNQLIDVFSNELLIHSRTDDSIIYSDRNQAFEDNFIEEIKNLHHAFSNQENLLYLTPEQLFENYWMLHATERMKQMGVQVFGANELKSFKFNINKPVISVNLKSNTDWFDIEIEVSFGNQKASLKELQKSFIKKTNYVTLGDGTLGILPEEWMKKFSGYFKTGEIKKNGIQISNFQFGIIDELYEEMENKPKFLVELYEKKKRLQNISNIEEIAIPKGIKAKLRDYQHHGLNWLAFLDKNQLGGCLADDMGLGKTLQTITFLQYLKTQNKNNPPSLIIAPTSLIFNWKNEIEKFCPSLKMLVYVGNNRAENKDQFSKYDLIISTYGSLLNDIEFLKDFQFHYVILDESQAIKNPNSKRYKSVRLLNSYNRLVLTGTPIENNTFDLYAQLNFLNPGLLGNMSHFKSNFSDAIDKEKDLDSSQLLSKIISPFLLRRTKEQVATELPEKTESIIYCEMEKEQRKVYDAFKNKYRDYLLNKIDENGVAKSQMYILEGLTKLRQICNATSMINDEEDYGNYSVKLENLIENIKEKTGNHKILVFSQFVKMLQIIKTRLDDEQIQYEYLDGQTTNRQENVNNFQNNANVRVFLISLKAGGTGLNLTEADYVFIVDPWWNPAVENQAIDRCYRIGQTKKVMAYRMICRDTIEEKIVALQGKKKAVASSIISIDDEKKSFDINEVKELFG
jgi:SNF2 family DNA or RNA helicase